jgi:PAS domain S-box-containing protein
MSWVTIVWSATASACLTLAAIHLLVWFQRRTVWADLLFALSAVAVASYAGLELAMMRADTPEQFATELRWLHVPVWIVTVSLVGFVRLRLQAGRPWLAWGFCGLRTAALLLNFVVGQNLNYREVTALRHIPFLGESVSVGVGVPNPWMLVGQLSLLLFLVFNADAMISVWRRGDRRQALLTGGSILLFALTGIVQAVLVLWQLVDWPLSQSVFYLGIVLAMGYEIGREALRASHLSDALLESEARMTLASEAAGIGVWIWTLATDRVWGSERWLRLHGYATDATVTLAQVLARIDLDDRERMRSEVRDAGRSGGAFTLEYRVVLPDGVVRWILTSGRMYVDPQGKPARILGVAADVTGRKESERQIEQQRDQLAHLGRVMNLSELSGALAHELNQPLAIILTNAQAAQRLLQQQPPDLSEAREILVDIVSEDERAGEIIKRLRGLLKTGETHLQPLSVNELVEDVLRIVRSGLAERGVKVHVALDASVPPVIGDRIQLQQVLLNLILNAGDAMSASPPSGRHLTLATTHHDRMARISVSDTGCGLPSNPERVFEAFYTTKKEGLGLGLSICRSIARAHNGRLWAEPMGASGVPGATATAGRGATFHLELRDAAGGTP